MNKQNIHKTLSEVIVSWNVTTTYIWNAFIAPTNTLATSKWQAVWKIQKIISTVSWWTTTTEYYTVCENSWNMSEDYNFIWDNRASYNYK